MLHSTVNEALGSSISQRGFNRSFRRGFRPDSKMQVLGISTETLKTRSKMIKQTNSSIRRIRQGAVPFPPKRKKHPKPLSPKNHSRNFKTSAQKTPKPKPYSP